MNLPELSVRRWVLAFMINAVVVLFGLIAIQRIGVDRYPTIDFPVVSVQTVLPGANPDIVDASITNIIETAVNSVPGIDYIASTSSPGLSFVNVRFALDKDLDVAFTEVQAKVNQILRELPDDADPPVVAKVEVGASAVLWLSLYGDRTLQQLNQYSRNVVKKRLETIDGVGEIQIGGRRERTIRINVDLVRAAAFGITAQDIRTALRREHLQMPGGFLVSDQGENLIKLDLEFHSPEQLEQLIVRYVDGAPVRLVDFANVEDGLEDFRQIARYNGLPAIGLGVVKVSNANTVAVVDAVKKRLREEIVPQLPPGLFLEASVDTGVVIKARVDALKNHLIEGTLLAGLVVLLFLRSFPATLIIATAIPVSLLGSIALMYFLGYTFNSMTLLALLLLIGVVVDDAIVVLENIFRHQEQLGEAPLEAALNGSRQVVFAVVASSLTLVSIFGSVLFLGGILGRFFESFAAVVAAGVLASLMVSLTLTPMLCSKLLRVPARHGRIYAVFGRLFAGLDRFYGWALDKALRYRWTTVFATLLLVASSGLLFPLIGAEFTPGEDDGRFLVNFRAPLGTSIEANNRYLTRIESVLDQYPEIETSFSAIGLDAARSVNKGLAYVTLVPPHQRQRSQEEIITQVQRDLAGLPGVQAFVSRESPIGGQRGEELQFALTGPDLSAVAVFAEQLRDRVVADPRFAYLDMELDLSLPQIRLSVDRTRASDLGLTAEDVALAVNMLAGGMDVAKYNDEPGDGERYDVRVKAQDGQLRNASDLRWILLRTADGGLVRLDSIARLEDTTGPAQINRMDLQYAARFFGANRVPLGEALSIIRDLASELLPPGYQIKLLSRSREFSETTGYIRFSLVLAVVLVFMVLASQFNSLVQPLIVMVAQPLAIIGGLFALWITGNTLNIFSMIGMVLLIGLVAKNSILLVDLTNQLRERGRAVDAALREACPIRMRPVLITSLTVMLALLPAAAGLEAGSETNVPLAVAVIGGMLSATLLTLVVVPAVYSLVEGRRERRHAQQAGPAGSLGRAV